MWQDVRALLFSLALAVALAPPPAIELMPENCPGPSLDARVATYLEESEVDASQWSAKGTLVNDAGQWLIRLEITAPTEEPSLREFSAGDCETVLDAAAFVFAVAVDPAVAAREVPPPSPPVDVLPKIDPELDPELEQPQLEPVIAPPEPADGPTPTEPSETRPTSPTGIRGTLRIAAGVMGGALPAAQALFVASGGLMAKRIRGDVVVRVRLPSEVTSQDRRAGGTLGMWSIGVRGCGLPRAPGVRVQFPVCLGLEGGQAFGRGNAFVGASRVRVPWGAATFAPGITLGLGKRWALVAQGDVGLSFNTAQLNIDGLGPVHTIGRIFGRGVLGVELRI